MPLLTANYENWVRWTLNFTQLLAHLLYLQFVTTYIQKTPQHAHIVERIFCSIYIKMAKCWKGLSIFFFSATAIQCFFVACVCAKCVCMFVVCGMYTACRPPWIAYKLYGLWDKKGNFRCIYNAMKIGSDFVELLLIWHLLCCHKYLICCWNYMPFYNENIW